MCVEGDVRLVVEITRLGLPFAVVERPIRT